MLQLVRVDKLKLIPQATLMSGRTALATVLLAVSPACAERYAVTVERSAPAKMRDGVTLRADIFPRYDRNLSTGEDQATGTRMIKATNRVYHDREHPSALMLPIVPR